MPTPIIEFYWLSSWVDESAYVVRVESWAGFEQAYGRVAGEGWLRLALDNSTGRFLFSGGPLEGYMYPGVGVRMLIGAVEVWRGYCREFSWSVAGEAGGLVEVHAVDEMFYLAQNTVSVEVESEKNVAEAVEELVGMASSPPATDVSDNGDVLYNYGHGWPAERTTALAALRDVCNSFYGRLWVGRDGTVRYWTRDVWQVTPRGVTLDYNVLRAAQAKLVLPSVAVWNRAELVIYPLETVGTVGTLWQSRSVLRVPPNGSREVLCPFKDSYGRRCGAADVVTVVPIDDYLVNDKRDGSGFNYTGSLALSVSMTVEKTAARVTFTSTATGALYVTFLRVRGKPIQTYDPLVIVEDNPGSQALNGRCLFRLDLPMLSDEDFAKSYAQYIVVFAGEPIAGVPVVEFEDEAGLPFPVWDIGERVRIIDEANGIDYPHYVRAINRLWAGGQFSERYWLEPRLGVNIWELDYCQLDSTTVLGF